MDNLGIGARFHDRRRDVSMSSRSTLGSTSPLIHGNRVLWGKVAAV